jgi:uncharacterized protein (TIGR02996 family)
MPTEARLLAQIESQPEDREVRLVYADWLEEQGEGQRAELTRVEEEMRRVPVHSDSYWQLKPRRNELREACDANWLARMRYGTDYEPVFGEVPDGWRERWRLLREFTERWHGIPMPDVGGHPREVRKVEKELKRELPPAMREWVAYIHDLMDQGRYEEVFRDCYRVEDLQDLSAVSLMILGEGDVYWAVKKEDLGAPDPPVGEYVLDSGTGDGERIVPARRLPPHVTSFVFLHMWTYVNLARNGKGFEGEGKLTAKLLRQLTDAFPVRSQFDGIRLFEKANMIVVLTPPEYGFDEHHIEVRAWKDIPRREVPRFLWTYNEDGDLF